MNTQDTRNQQMFKIRRTTLGFGVVQILLGASLTALSFTAFALTSSDRIRNACPYWAGFAGLCSRYSSRRSHASRSPESYTWADCSTDLTMLPPYAPPVYHSVDNFQEYGLSSCIVPPPVFDPTDLPPPYSSQNPSLAESRNSLTSPESSNNLPQSSETDVHFQPMRSSHQAGNYNEELRASAREECNLHDRGAPWDGHLNAMSDSSDLTASASSDLSSNCNRSFSDQQTNANDTDMYKTVLIGATPLLNHPAKSRIQAEFSELDEASPGSRRRTSSLQETLTKESTHTRNVPAVSRSPARGTPLLSLRTRSRSLGENAIYVNSFEVMARPPPNVRLPADEQLKTSNTAGHVTTRNTHRRTRKGMTLKGDSSKDHNSNRSEQRKEKVKKRRRRHSHSISRHKERWNANCESLNSQVNRGNDDSVTPGKETVV